MRIVLNEGLIERNRRLAQILFFVSIAFLIGSFFLSTQVAASDDLGFYFQCLTIPVLFGLVLLSVRMTNAWVRQPHPWEALQEGLKGIGGDTHLYNFVMPANHVLVNPNGIFAIVTRFQDSPQKVVDDTWQTTRSLLTFMRQEQLGNPTEEARQKAHKTEVFLQELLKDPTIRVQPVVVFVSPAANLTIEGEQTVPVLYANPDKKKYSLKNYLRDAKSCNYPTLSKEQIEQLDDLLLFED